MGHEFKDDAEKDRWRRAGGFVPGDLVCWYDQRWGGVHRVGTVKKIGRKPEHQVSVEWAGVEGLTEAQKNGTPHVPILAGIGPRIYPHVMKLIFDCVAEVHSRRPSANQPKPAGERMKPEKLDVGMRFRLTGDACNPAERNDKHIYEVVNKDLACELGAHLMVKDETGRVHEMRLMPWVPILRVEDGAKS